MTMPSPTRLPEVRGRAPSRNATVLVRVPADKDYVVLIRSAVGHLGAQLRCTVPEISDLRLAVNEACALLLDAQPAGPPYRGEDEALECRIIVRPDTLEIAVTAPPGQVAPPEPGSFGWNILAALVDELAWSFDGDVARIELVKTRCDAEPPHEVDARPPGS